MTHDALTQDLFSQAQLPALSVVRPVMLHGPTDLDGFRRAARRLLAGQIPPEQVAWHSTDAPVQDLFAGQGDAPWAAPADTSGDAPAVKVPAHFLALCESVILHRDPQRFGLLYRLLWRLAREPGLRHDPLDPDLMAAQHMAQAVRRDLHKMKAFVRFRTVQDERFRAHPQDGPLHVAWFEPGHHIVEAVAPFFARRFTQMRWAILTPERSVEWDGVGLPGGQTAPSAPERPAPRAGQLRWGPGANKRDAPPADAGEQLWLTYYRHTFNPARLKLKMMQKEMPRKYWRNLPEAALISPLAAQANERSQRMVAQPATTPARRLPPVKAAKPAALPSV